MTFMSYKIFTLATIFSFEDDFYESFGSYIWNISLKLFIVKNVSEVEYFSMA